MPNQPARANPVHNGDEAPWDEEFVTRLARALHEHYRREQAAAGDATARPWDELPAPFQASNLEHAAHIRLKLAAIGCRAVAGLAPDGEAFAFTEDEVTQLARMEHSRWVDERLPGDVGSTQRGDARGGPDVRKGDPGGSGRTRIPGGALSQRSLSSSPFTNLA
jgi:hypothetical protein